MRNWPEREPDQQAMERARLRWDNVAKPLNSLGKMEKLITKIAGIQGTEDIRLTPRCALVFCADHGIVAEGVTQSSSEVTAIVAHSVADGNANINLMAASANADVYAVDMGMAVDVDHPGMIVCKEAYGTDNAAVGPAMSYDRAERAIQHGIDLAGRMKQKGYCLIATGEMGIGNTTASSAAACALLNLPVEKMTGRGAGLSDEGLLRKVNAIHRALEVNKPNPKDAIDILAKVGGYELAGMTGAFLGGMIHRIPVVIDGVISAVSALIAARICPSVREFMLPSHISREPAGKLIMDELGFEPVIHADMALGEGTGAVMLFPMLDMAARVYQGTHTFDDLGMEAYTPQGGVK